MSYSFLLIITCYYGAVLGRSVVVVTVFLVRLISGSGNCSVCFWTVGSTATGVVMVELLPPDGTC